LRGDFASGGRDYGAAAIILDQDRYLGGAAAFEGQHRASSKSTCGALVLQRRTAFHEGNRSTAIVVKMEAAVPLLLAAF
jgi:hypothetical protein